MFDQLTDNRSYEEKSQETDRGPIEIEDKDAQAEYAKLLLGRTYYMGMRVSTLNAKKEQNQDFLFNQIAPLVRTANHASFA